MSGTHTTLYDAAAGRAGATTRRRGETFEQAQARRRAKFRLLFWGGFGRYGCCTSCGQAALVAGRRRSALKCEACIDALADPPELAGRRSAA